MSDCSLRASESQKGERERERERERETIRCAQVSSRERAAIECSGVKERLARWVQYTGSATRETETRNETSGAGRRRWSDHRERPADGLRLRFQHVELYSVSESHRNGTHSVRRVSNRSGAVFVRHLFRRVVRFPLGLISGTTQTTLLATGPNSDLIEIATIHENVCDVLHIPRKSNANPLIWLHVLSRMRSTRYLSKWTQWHEWQVPSGRDRSRCFYLYQKGPVTYVTSSGTAYSASGSSHYVQPNPLVCIGILVYLMLHDETHTQKLNAKILTMWCMLCRVK